MWSALLRYRDDGLIEIDNLAAERAFRGVTIDRRNYLFAGADSGGERAAAIYSLLGTAKLYSPVLVVGMSASGRFLSIVRDGIRPRRAS